MSLVEQGTTSNEHNLYAVVKRRTCTVKPCFHNQVINCVSIDDVGQTCRIKVPSTRVDCYVLQINVCSNGCKPHIAQPIWCEAAVVCRINGTNHCSLIISRKSLWYTIRSNTEPRARPSWRLKVAENPMMGILCGREGGRKSGSGFLISGSKWDNSRR